MTGALITSSGEEHRGFHQCPNVLRDKYGSLIGLDGYGLVNYLLSWANSGTALSQRRMMSDLGVSQSKLERVQALVLERCGHFITMTPGDRVRANRWHLDMRKLWAENAARMAQSYAARVAAEGVPEINTPPRKAGKGVLKPDTGCSENQYRGVLKPDTLKDSTNTTSNTGGVFNVEEGARTPGAQSTALPVAVDPAPCTTENAARKDVGGQTLTASLGRTSRPEPWQSGSGRTNHPTRANARMHSGKVPNALGQISVTSGNIHPPIGGAAHAAQGGDLISEKEFGMFFGSQDSQATNPEHVPGGAAGGACGAPEAPGSLRVADLASVPRDELLSRSVARGESPQLRMIRSLVTGTWLSQLLEEPTPTGALCREDWLRLTLDELEQVKVAAQTQAREQRDNMITLSIAGLDRMIGAVPKPKSPRPGDEGGADPAQVTRFDPQLALGGRCTVDGQLGVVFEVTHAHYIVDLDCGDRLSVGRALRAELLRLGASEAPAPVLSPREAEVNRYEVGACWRDRQSGAEVVITSTAQVRHRAGQRLQYTLSSGERLSALDLTLGYEFIGLGRAARAQAAD